jgi:hypothetical protein
MRIFIGAAFAGEDEAWEAIAVGGKRAKKARRRRCATVCMCGLGVSISNPASEELTSKWDQQYVRCDIGQRVGLSCSPVSFIGSAHLLPPSTSQKCWQILLYLLGQSIRVKI